MGKGMKAGKRPKQGTGGGMSKQMQQMAALERQMEAIQAELNEKEITATSGGGAVSVTVSGAKQITAVSIDKEVVDPDDVEMLQDLIMTAANEALRQIEELSNQEMGKLTAGLGFPGI